MTSSKQLANFKDFVLPVLAILVSVAALINSIQTSSRNAAPNVQLLEVYAQNRGRIDAEGTQDKIIGFIKLKNYGKATAQIVNVRSEPIAFKGNIAYTSMFYISDESFIKIYQDASGRDALDAQIDNLELYQVNPILGIKNPFIFPNETRELQFFMVNTNEEAFNSIPTLRVILTFSNGQEIIILPELEYMGGSVQLGER